MKALKPFALRLNFIFAILGTVGSLYFSEILKYPPCVLCWYQRICLYPLVLVFGTALWSEDKNYRKYVYPLAAVGFALAAYHNLLYYGVISEALAPCTAELSCTSKQLELFGFITIPLLSLIGFTTILVLTYFDSSKGIDNEK